GETPGKEADPAASAVYGGGVAGGVIGWRGLRAAKPTRSAEQPMNPQPPPPRRHRTRYELPGHARFLTFSCYRSLPLLRTEATRDILETAMFQARETFRFKLYAWVIMPNHVHMLLKPDLPAHPVA